MEENYVVVMLNAEAWIVRELVLDLMEQYVLIIVAATHIVLRLELYAVCNACLRALADTVGTQACSVQDQ
jgi:hypothetical protein